MTFFKWLLRQEYRTDPVGNLAYELARDRGLPDKKTKSTLLMHLVSQFKDTRPLHMAWKEYKEYRKVIL